MNVDLEEIPSHVEKEAWKALHNQSDQATSASFHLVDVMVHLLGARLLCQNMQSANVLLDINYLRKRQKFVIKKF